jgi:uncharacterized membrane protein
MSSPRPRVLRRRLIAGMIAIAPITVTALVIWWIFVTVDGLLGQFLYPVLPFPIPGLGLVTLLLILFLVGWAAERAIGSRVADGWHSLLDRIPVTRRIYRAANRIVRTVFAEESRPFKTVVLVEYPSPGRWAIGFLAGSAPQAIRASVPDAVSVFMPTTPNPTTGFLIILPRSLVRELPMTVDQAFTYILSAGAATPEELRAAGDTAALPVGAPSGAP